MLRDLTSQKKVDKQAVLAAIKSLQGKGWDVNPYTVADEAKIPRSTLYRNPELMALVAEARGEAVPVDSQGPDELASQIKELEQRTRELEEQIQELRENNEVLARLHDSAWQQGFQAGLAEATRLAEPASKADTTDGGVLAPAGATAEVELDEPKGELSEPVVESDWGKASSEPVPAAPDAGLDQMDSPVAGQPSPPLADRDELISSGQTMEFTPTAEEEQLDQAEPISQRVDDSAEITVDDSFDDSLDEELDEELGQRPEVPPAKEPVLEVDELVSPLFGEPEEPSPAPSEVELEPIDLPVDMLLEEAAGEDFQPESEEGALPPFSPEERTAFSEEDLRDLLKYRFGRSQEEPAEGVKEGESGKKAAGSKFVGGAKAGQEPPRQGFVIKNVTPDIRKACLVLGLRPEELSHETVHRAWKREISRDGMHPDQGGDTEIAVYLNTAKDTLYHWLDAQAPKLGKKFGSAARESRDSKEGQEPADSKSNQSADAGHAPQA